MKKLSLKNTEFNINQHVLIFLLISIGLITLPHVNHIPLPLFATFNLLLAWRFLCIWKKEYLPNKTVLLLLTIAAITLLYKQHQGILGRDAGTSLFITALGLKLLETTKERDLYLINYLAFIVASSQFLYQQNILMALYILFVCCVLLATLISINSQKPEITRALKTTSIIVFQALPLSIILFVLFPRVEAPKWMWFEQQPSAITGLSDSLEPGAISQLGLSDELVFRAKFTNTLPPSNQRYWRGPVYSYTDGQRWKELKAAIKDKDTIIYAGKQYQYTVMMEAQNKNWVFALDMPSSFPQSLKKNTQHQLINPNNKHQRAEYKFTSHSQYNTGDITEVERQKNLQLPVDASNAIKTLVTQLKGFDHPPEFFIQSLLSHFKNENFHYTLRPPLMGDKPIDNFLFNNRYGFCSHYATAFVYLMREANIPARVVGGYQGGELNQVGGFLEIKQANAHAWAEVWLEGEGWVSVDPTAQVAPDRITSGLRSALKEDEFMSDSQFSLVKLSHLPWLNSLRLSLDNLNYQWHQSVLNFNKQKQSSQLKKWFGQNYLEKSLYWLIGLFIAIFFASAGLLLWTRAKLKLTPVQKSLSYLDKRLSIVELQRKESEGFSDYSLRLQLAFPQHNKSIAFI